MKHYIYIFIFTLFENDAKKFKLEQGLVENLVENKLARNSVVFCTGFKIK